MKTKETEAKEIMNRVVLEYYLVKKRRNIWRIFTI